MYVVLGATGNTGSMAAKKLLERGEKVRVVGRDAAKLASFFLQERSREWKSLPRTRMMWRR